MIERLKEACLVFGSIVAVILGAVLLCVNVRNVDFSMDGYLVATGLGILFLAAGLTGFWALWRYRRGWGR